MPPADIDLVHPGQDVNLNFSALDMRWTPRIRGTVRVVSADATLDPMTGMFHYTAEISPDAEDLKSLGDQTILPGMPVDAYIQTGERTPLSYLVKPLMDYFERALKER